jgi:hypothetical protein
MRALLALALIGLGCSGESPSSGAEDDPPFPERPYTTVTTEAGGASIAVRTAPSQPPTRGTSTIELTITSASGAPIDGLALDVVPWMAAHGHGTSARPSVTPEGRGRYVLHNVNLFMPGEWQLKISLSGSLTDHAAPVVSVP